MLNGGNAMKEKLEIMNELDKAIDAMDTERIDLGLEALAGIESLPFQAENSKLFAARIKKMKMENINMKNPRRFINAAVVAAAIMAMGVTAYAANGFKVFSFVQDNKAFVVRTNENVDTDSIQIEENPDAIIKEDPELSKTEYTFNTAAEAEKDLDIKIVLPAVTTQMNLVSATGITSKWDDMESRNVYLKYVDIQGRNMNISAAKIVSDGTVVSSYDLGDNNPGNYINKLGTDFIISNETDQITYFVARGEYQYSISFSGYTENEQKEIVDTLDLSDYK